MTKQELTDLRKLAAATAVTLGCNADIQVAGFVSRTSDAVRVTIIVVRHVSATKCLKREVAVRLGSVGAAEAVEKIVRDTALQLSQPNSSDC